MEHLADLNNYKEFITIVLGFITLGAGLYKYFHAREHELKWKQAEFVLNQAHYLETDEDIIDAIMVLRKEHIYSVSDIFSDNSKLEKDELFNYRKKFYKLFNLLDRLAYLCLYKQAISLSEMSNFGMYFTTVSRNKTLAAYCKKHSFPLLLKMANELEDHFIKRKKPNNPLNPDAQKARAG